MSKTVVKYPAMNSATPAKVNPESLAASSMMELRYAISKLGLHEAHGLMDEIEHLLVRKMKSA